MKTFLCICGVLLAALTSAQIPQTQVNITASQLPYTIGNEAAATGGTGISYQWYRNGVVLGSETAATLTVPAGDYTEGTVSVTYTRAAKCSECPTWQYANPITVAICPSENLPIPTLTHSCGGTTTATFTAGGSSGSHYSWSTDGATFGAWEANAKAVSLAARQEERAFVKVRHAANGCIAAPIGKAASLPTIAAVSPNAVSDYAVVSTALTATPGAGATVDWYTVATGGTVAVAGNTTYDNTNAPRGAYAQARNVATGCVSSVRTFAYVGVNYPYRGTAYGVSLKTGKYLMEAWGAQGGSYIRTGGLGGHTYGTLALTAAATTLYFYIGGVGHSCNGTAGWNGGGAAKGNGSYYQCGGGGASDVRTSGADASATWNTVADLRSRILVAGGGGGAQHYTSGSNGGDGGGLVGVAGTQYNNGGVNLAAQALGGTQVAGGTGAYGPNTNGGTPNCEAQGGNGGFGIGGVKGSGSWGGGGGGGWYGGGCGTCNSDVVGSGGGGSSFIMGHPGCNPVNASGTHLGFGTTTGSYVFTNPVMLQGVRNGNGQVRVTPVP